MVGAVLGDIVGSVYEFSNIKTKNFLLFCQSSSYIDDSIITIAAVDWLFHKGDLTKAMQYYGKKYPCPMGGYGSSFVRWLNEEHPKPYNNWGNGSAMRVSPVGWYFNSLEETSAVAREIAIVTHNHPEGVKGAQAAAAAIFLSRHEKSKEYIREFIETTLGYDLHYTCDEVRPTYCLDASCQGTVPEAIIAFLEGNSFEDAIRLAISLGGDSDTPAYVTGGIVESFYRYQMPHDLIKKVETILKLDLRKVVWEFRKERHEYLVYPRWRDCSTVNTIR